MLNARHVRDQKQLLGSGPWAPLKFWMDYPVRRLGPRHRRVRHADTDPGSMFLAALLFGPTALAGMIVHTLRDRMQSELQRTLNKFINELFKTK